MQRWLSTLLLLFLCPAGGAASLTFQAAWEVLQQEDDRLAAGRAASERASELAGSSVSRLLPQVDLVGSYTHLDRPVELDALALRPLSDVAGTLPGQLLIDLIGEERFITPVTQRDVVRSSLMAFWPLYTGGRVDASRDLLVLEEEQSRALLEEVRRARFLELVTAYFAVVLGTINRDTRALAEQTLSAHLDAAAKREQQGLLSSVDRLAVRVAHDQARIDLRVARDSLKTAVLTLERLVHREGVEPSTQMVVNRSLPDKTSMSTALEQHPALQVLDIKQKEARRLASAARGAYHPNLFLFGSYNLYEDDSLASDLTPDWLVGVGVRMPLLDRSGRRGKVRAAELTERETRRLRQGAKRDLNLLLEHRYRHAAQALQEYRDQKSSVQLAEETLRLRQRAFEEGLGRALDVVDAQTMAANVRTRRNVAAFRYLVALAGLLSLTGELETFSVYLAQGEPVQ